MGTLVCFGTAAIDLYFKSDHYNRGNGVFDIPALQRTDTEEFFVHSGGGAVNVAIGAKKQGMDVILAAVMGVNTFTELVLSKLDELGVDHSLSEIKAGYQNVSIVLIQPNGERCIVNYRSPVSTRYDTEDQMLDLFCGETLFMANLPNIVVPVRTKILAKAKAHGVRTILSLGVQDAKLPVTEFGELLASTDILIMNAYEFAELVKTPYQELDFGTDMRHLLETKGVAVPGLIIITDAEKGSYAYTSGKVFHQNAVVPAQIVDENGAGDAFTAGFLSIYLSGGDIIPSLRSGAEYAAKILARLGAN
jgi:sugar/nucleoside kinase (ribokinase family)